MKRAGLALLLVVALASLGQAQNPRRRAGLDSMRADTGWNPAPVAGAMDQQDPQRAAMLRAQVEDRFYHMVQNNLALTDQQMSQVTTALRANQDRRIALGRREQDLRLAMARQMQPGQAADADSVSRMTEALSHLKLERAQSDDQMVRYLSFLPPVKRAQLLGMMQRFEARIADIRRQSLMNGRPMGFRRRPL